MCTSLFFKYSIRELLGKDGLRCNICETECTDDKIRGRKISTLKKLAIGNFMYDNYLSTLKNYIYIYIIYIMFIFCRRTYMVLFEEIFVTRKLEVYLQFETMLKRIYANFNLEV